MNKKDIAITYTDRAYQSYSRILGDVNSLTLKVLKQLCGINILGFNIVCKFKLRMGQCYTLKFNKNNDKDFTDMMKSYQNEAKAKTIMRELRKKE